MPRAVPWRALTLQSPWKVGWEEVRSETQPQDAGGWP